MLLGLILFPTIAILAGAALASLAPDDEPFKHLVPAAQIVAFATFATVLVAALFDGELL